MTLIATLCALFKDAFTSAGRTTVFLAAAVVCLMFGGNFFLADDLLFSPSVTQAKFVIRDGRTPRACEHFKIDTPQAQGTGDLAQCRAEFGEEGDLKNWSTALYKLQAGNMDYDGPEAAADQGDKTWDKNAWLGTHVCGLPKDDWTGPQLKILRLAILKHLVTCPGPQLTYRLDQSERGWGWLATALAAIVWLAASVAFCLLCVLAWQLVVIWWRRRPVTPFRGH